MSGVVRLTLVRHAPTEATRRHAFPLDEPLDTAGEAEAAALNGRLPAVGAISAPAARCRRTAELAGFEAHGTDPRWSELDFGAWAGATLTEIGERDPERLQAWLDDPASPPPGGENLGGLRKRVQEAMSSIGDAGEHRVVFTSGGPIKAAIANVLEAPDTAFWRLDVAPCSVSVLHCRGGIWTVRRLNAAAGGPR
ncbi:histidine phosphatase family protein [Glycomyces luteolus]|uniref:Histidine phosphatase family protein n=1 Tax=Glycomyces luteolus TaxID=2670330 RepID=A0A9X3T5C2_9ACTN|nr:histidine phosphatase family protein [Glycomyces luteolus]MDA1361915.1 histidine phosphatase family protein [Glycomyces luteolus]